MAEWHLPPDYIINNWTDELLELMVEKMAERKKREVQAIPPALRGEATQMVSNSEFFRLHGDKIKVVKRA